MNRRTLTALPAEELARHADAALRDAAARHGFAPVRAAALPRQLQIEAVLNAARRATVGG